MKGAQKNPAEPRIPLCAGGSKSEGQWRREFANGGSVLVAGKTIRVAGLPIHGPAQPDVEVGINEVWKMFNLGKLLIFEDLRGLLDELQSYSRELDDLGEATEKIDSKEDFHGLDSLRYAIGYLRTDRPQATISGSPVASPGPFSPNYSSVTKQEPPFSV